MSKPRYHSQPLDFQQWLLLYDLTSSENWILPDTVAHPARATRWSTIFWLTEVQVKYSSPNHRIGECILISEVSSNKIYSVHLKGACGGCLLFPSVFSCRREEPGLCNAGMQVWVTGLRHRLSEGPINRTQALRSTDSIYRQGRF